MWPTEEDVEIAESDRFSFIKHWYILDTNSLPPVYVLRHLQDIKDAAYWSVALPVIGEALRGVAFQEWGQHATSCET